MSTLVKAALLAALLLLTAVFRPAVAADADLVINATNAGESAADNTHVEVHKPGRHSGDPLADGRAGQTLQVPAATYDILVTFEDGAAHKEIWLNGQVVSGRFEKTVEIGLPVASVTYRLTNGGEETEGKAMVELHPAGRHDGPTVAWARSGGELRVPAGSYDVVATFEDGAAKKAIWFDREAFAGIVEKTVEFGVKVASVTYKLTNNGEDVEGKGVVELHPAGRHDGPTIVWAHSGGEMRLPEGTYDVYVEFEDGAAKKELWFDRQAFAGTVEKAVEFGVNVASVTYKLTNNGEDVEGKGIVELHPAGRRDGPTIAWAHSGGEMRVPAGTYDIHVAFEDGAAKREMWFDRQAITGTVEKTLEFGANVASVTYKLTNNGEDVEGKGIVELHPAGRHDGPTIVWARSGGEMRLPAGSYDVYVAFEDGVVKKEIWSDRQTFAGKVEKTVDFGVKVASVTYRVTNDGEDVGDAAHVDVHPAGRHDAATIVWSRSGGEMRLPPGRYDVEVGFVTGLVSKTVWLNGETFDGKMERPFDLGIKLAEPVLAATLNGADAGDRARISVYPAGSTNELGGVAGGASATVEEGAYDLQATMPGAEGWLRNVRIVGKPRLTVAMQALRTAELKPGAPAPSACTIEVYGVNFDFDKAVLRPDSEPVLKAVLKLFTDSPAFIAEIGGHTDNTGAAAYNQSLSTARAVAVKDWLLAHGVAAARASARGYGDTRPLVENDSDANRFKNRRVELRRANCKGP